MMGKIVNFSEYLGVWKDIWGDRNDVVAVLVEHHTTENKLRIKVVNKENKTMSIDIEPVKAVELLMALETALDLKKKV